MCGGGGEGWRCATVIQLLSAVYVYASCIETDLQNMVAMVVPHLHTPNKH